MALPATVEDLLMPGDLPPNWWQAYGRHAWCRLPGLESLNKVKLPYRPNGKQRSPLFHKDGLRMLRTEEVRQAACERVPRAWQEAWPALTWDEPIGIRAMNNVLNGVKEPLPLDRAGLALAAIDVVLDRFGEGRFAITDHVRIAPAIFQLEGFTNSFYKNFLTGASNTERFMRIKRSTKNFCDEFYDDLCDGGLGTQSTLLALSKALKDEFKDDFNGGRVRLVAEPNGYKAARLETPVFTLGS